MMHESGKMSNAIANTHVTHIMDGIMYAIEQLRTIILILFNRLFYEH